MNPATSTASARPDGQAAADRLERTLIMLEAEAVQARIDEIESANDVIASVRVETAGSHRVRDETLRLMHLSHFASEAARVRPGSPLRT